ncbi:hypothetical protein [Saccharophagus degradans]|uniref:Uncharacterized protein n=1 Tax=Saccharophagus degradans (strain 2-40 / ATCC 43961 / DSM 17024) TaxID=203122 RepID=Q21GQ9_SACD2|nr:hypothetical protein [Saccharophagus degradans]ABD82120.1 conserved hypothetical protein [Saccharophagus degradans 2-40]
MAIKTGEYLNTKDVYIDYPFEEVMFRRMKKNGAIYRKFYGEKESTEVIHYQNKLYNEALLSGDEITQEEYEIGEHR